LDLPQVDLLLWDGGIELKTNYRILTVLVLSLLLLCSAFGAAEPGGNGDSIQNMQCGGACHGDASINETSGALLSLSSPAAIYVGIPTTLTLTATNLDTSATRLVGLFLLTDMTGHSDTPQDAGWEILSDANGGAMNYNEQKLDPGQTEISISWVLRASTLGPTTFYAAIHHGGGDSSPFFGTTASGFEVTVQPVPENLPRLSADFTPPTLRTLDIPTEFNIETQFTDSMQFEWKSEDGLIMNAIVNSTGNNSWTATIPAALQPTTVQWRVLLGGEGPEQTTPWFTLAAEEDSWEVTESAAYLQAFALLFMSAGIVIALQTRFSSDASTSKYDEELAEIKTVALDKTPGHFEENDGGQQA
jgi:hypothetical protein